MARATASTSPAADPVDVQHGGCYDCKAKDEPVLVSVLIAGESRALCSTCRSGVVS